MLLHYLEVKEKMKQIIAECEFIGDTTSPIVKVASESLVIAETELRELIRIMQHKPVAVGQNRIWINSRNNYYVVETFRYNDINGQPRYGVLGSFPDLKTAARYAADPSLYNNHTV